jgi:hypothetical protein
VFIFSGADLAAGKFPGGPGASGAAVLADFAVGGAAPGATVNRKSHSPFAAVRTPAGSARKKSRKNPESEWIAGGEHEALVSRDLFDKVQVKLAGNRRRTSPRKSAPFALSGLLVCGNCGKRMIAHAVPSRAKSGGSPLRRYCCSSYHARGSASGCGFNTVTEDRMVAAVAAKLSASFTTPGAVAALRDEVLRQESEPAADPRPALAAREADLTARIGRLVTRLEDDLPEVAVADIRGRLTALSAERDAVRKELAAARSAPPRVDPAALVDRFVARVHRLAEVFRKGEPGEVSAVLRTLLDKVEVFFTHERARKTTRSAFAHALLYPNPEGWVTPSPNLSDASRRTPCTPG